MHAAAIFVVEAHLAELQAEAIARRAPPKPGPSPIQRFVTAVRDSLATRQEPFVPRLESYPYGK